MGILVSWAANQGLSLGQDLFSDMLELPSFEGKVVKELEQINQKLNIMIGSPFRKARMHLLEGNIQRAKDCLIEAISVNEFDLPARAMYGWLLYESGNCSLAVEYFEDIVAKFGPHVEIVPEPIRNLYARYLLEEKPLRAMPEFSVKAGGIRGDYYQPVMVICTISCIIVRWESGSTPVYVGGTMGGYPLMPRIAVYDWSGKAVMDETIYHDPLILAASAEYLVVSRNMGVFFKNPKIEVFRTKDGSRVALPDSLSNAQVAELFVTDQKFTSVAKGSWPSPSFDFTFAGVRVRSSGDGDRQLNFAPE